MRAMRRLVGAVLVVTLPTLACEPRCTEEQVARNGACVEACNGDADCGRGKVCQDGACEVGERPGASSSSGTSTGASSSAAGPSSGATSSLASSGASASSTATSGAPTSSAGASTATSAPAVSSSVSTSTSSTSTSSTSSATSPSATSGTATSAVSQAGTSSATSTVQSSSNVPTPLAVVPADAVVTLGNSVRFQAQGGIPPATFSLASGEGRLDADGTFRRVWTATRSATIQLTDARLAIAHATVTFPEDTLMAGGPGDDAGWDVRGLPDGSILVAGEHNLGVNHSAYEVVRFDPFGQVVWRAQQDSTGVAAAVAIIPNGTELLVVGHTTGVISSSLATGQGTLFVAKHSMATGALIHVMMAGTSGQDFALGASLVNLAGTPRLCVAGSGGGSTPSIAQQGGGADQLLVVFDVNNLSVKSMRLWGSNAYDAATGCLVGADGNLYAAGYTAGLMGAQSAGLQDVTLTRFLPASDSPSVVKQFGGAGADRAFNLQAAGATLVLTGYSSSPAFHGATLHGGEDDCAVLAVNASTLNVVVGVLVGTPARERCYTAAVSGQTMIVAGQITGSIPGQASAGGTDAYFAGVDLNGSVLFQLQAGSDAADGINGASLAADGDILLVGDTLGTWGTRSPSGGQDMVVLKVDPFTGARR